MNKLLLSGILLSPLRIMMLSVLLVFAILALCVYYGLAQKYGYWKKRGVPYPPPSLLFGNIGKALILKKSLGQIYSKLYEDYAGLSYVGFYKANAPGIVVRDPDLIKKVLVTNFSSFHDNEFFVDEKADPLFSKNPFVLRGHDWKVAKNLLTPSFTSKRVKEMFPLVQAVCERLIQYLSETPMGKDGLEAKNLAGKYTTDVVATCAFGLEANSFKDPNAQFVSMGKKLLTPSVLNAIKFLILLAFPTVTTIMGIKLVPDEVAEYFTTIVEKSIEHRKKNNLVRGDFLDVMLELRSKVGESNFNNEDITAHALGFFADGYETSSIVISFILYELAANSDVQVKLREEVDAVLRRNGGRLTYDAIQEMSYLEKVFCETMRIHPAALFIARLCTEPFTFPPPSGVGPAVVIEKDVCVVIPVVAIQNDPKYYPDPNRFDPERFSDTNKESLPKNTYFPFGDGPRVCLGKRFGVLQSKMAIVNVIANFEVKVNRKTITPIQLDPLYFLGIAKGGLWLDFHARR